MTEKADIPNKYGTPWGGSALSLSAFFGGPLLLKARSEFKSFRLGIDVIPIKGMYLERLRKTLTGQ